MNAANDSERTGLWVSCHRATELLSKRHDAPLTSRERLALRIHLLLCTWCRRYGNQITVLHEALRLRAADGEPAGPSLSPEARKRIRAALDARL